MPTLLIAGLLLAWLAAYDAAYGFRVSIRARIGAEGIQIAARFAHPLVEVLAGAGTSPPAVTVRVLRVRVLRMRLVRKPGRKYGWVKRLISAVSLSELDVSASYGLRDPFALGLLQAAAGIAASRAGAWFFRQSADYLADREYVFFRAEARLHAARSLCRYMKG